MPALAKWASLTIMIVCGCAPRMDRSVTASLMDHGQGAQLDPEAALGQYVTAPVADPITGLTQITGELVATYDDSTCDSASADLACAIYLEPGQTLRFVRPCSLAAMQVLPRPTGFRGFRARLRELGIVLRKSPLTGTAFALFGNAGIHRCENQRGNFAWDLVRTDATPRTFAGTGRRHDDYFVWNSWNSDVRLPVAGTVFEAVDDQTDLPPCAGAVDVDGTLHNEHLTSDCFEPSWERADGNRVGIRVPGTNLYFYFLHLRQGSIPLAVKQAHDNGATIQADTIIGKVGNSGRTLQPHLHVSLLWYDAATTRSWGVPLEFASVYLATSPSTHGTLFDYAVPKRGTWISSEPF